MNNRALILTQVAIWALLFLSPLTFLNHGNGMAPLHYAMLSVSTVLMMVVFYVNYLWLVPGCLIKGQRTRFLVINVVMVVALGVAQHHWMVYVHDLFGQPDMAPRHKPGAPVMLMFVLRDIFNLAMVAVVATTIVLALRWRRSEQGRLEAEAARADAELRNLRSQLNPHFLLNTLNNIYALTAIDPARAQDAVMQLSRLLRHMLYDNQQAEVALNDEIQFLENYVSLMRIRLPQSVDVSFAKEVDDPGRKIAPLIFVSLVENAFKHGVSPTEPSFIHISVKSADNRIICYIENSNHPKSEQDRSGHGIGLQQVQRRLDLAYPGRYEWERGATPDGKTYVSCITIHS